MAFFAKRLVGVAVVAALAVVVGIFVVHLSGILGGTDGVTTPKPSSNRVLLEAAARIAEESRGAAQPRVVEAAPLPPLGDADARTVKPQGTSTLPDGLSIVGFHGEMAKAPIVDRRGGDGPAGDQLDWLDSPIGNLAAQAASTGRGWSFGWIRLADNARRPDVATSLENAGAEIVGSAGRLLRVRLPGDEGRLAAIAALPAVDGLGAMSAQAKLRAFDDPSMELPDEGPVPVFVTLMADDADGRWGRELEARGAVVGRYDPAVRVYAAAVARDRLDALASADFVLAVEPIGIVEPAHDTAVPAMGADALRVHGGSPGIFTGMGGESVPIGVMDTGLNINHPDIAEHRDSICGVNLYWFDPAGNDQDLWLDRRNHGTHVTGTFAGNGFLAPRFAGMAPSVRHIRFAKVFHHDQEVISGAFTDMINRAMDFLAEESGCAGSVAVRPLIVNMSLAASSSHFVGRDVNARKLDATVWRHRQLYVVAQSNEGAQGFSNYAAAKNSLSVGAVSDDGAVAAFSSHGPTADGRLAPQVVGTGHEVCSTEGNGKGAGYICFQGTSMAAPSVAGVAALLMDANPDYGSQPALARARLMASAVRPDAWLDHQTVFPTTNSGGPGRLQATYGMGRVSARLAVVDRDQADGWTGGGAVAEVEDESEYAYSDIVVPEGATRLDVVMTWDEPPTEAIATPVLNDLDLWLDRDADCADGPCGEQSSISRIDNVEWIVVRNPRPGTYRAKVVPRRIYTAPPKAAVSWTVIRGASTPSLGMTVVETSSEESGDERRLEVGVEVTADAYVAAGVRLHLECRGENSGCDELAVAGSTIGREDGVTRDASRVEFDGIGQPRNERRRPIGMATKIALGEVAVGESQSVTLDVVYSGDEPVHLYLTASAWNGRGVSQAVLIDPPGADPDSDPDPVEAPANDDFANAHRLSTGEGSVPVDPPRATPEPGEPVLHAGYGRPLGSVWYEWTAPSTDLVRFGVAPASRTSMDAYLDVYRGDRIAALDHIVSNRSRELIRYTLLGGVPYPVYRTIFTDAVLFAEEGETYRVRIAHGEPSAPLVMRWRQGPRPENDDFPDAVVLSGPEGGIVGTNLGATLESGESFGPLAATTWYRWTAPEDGSWRFRIDTDHLLRVAAFTGDGTDDLRLVSGLPSSTVYFAARGGAEYRIAVASRDAVVSGGSYDLAWQKEKWTPASGDHFSQAGVADSFFSLGHHTVQPGEPVATGVRTRWWSWTAPETGRFTWKLDSNRTELTVAAFTGDALENLELVRSTGPDVTSREFSFPAVEGERYWVSVGWPAGDYGAYAWPSASGRLFRGLTPRNDGVDGAIALGSTRGLTAASNAYATTAPGELGEQLGHSTVWWTYEAPTPGWYEFHTTGTQPALAVFEVDATGSLREISRNRDGRVVFLAEAGKQYAIRASTLDGTYGGSLGLYWRPVDAPAWLRYVGSFADAEDPQGDAVQLIDAGSLVIDAEDSRLYAVSAAGLAVFGRNADTGALTDGTSLDEDLSGSVLLLDTARERLIADRCGTWRVYTGLDDADGIEGDDLTVEGDPANCGRRLLLEPEGAFLYRVAPGQGIDVFAVEGGGLRYLQTTQLADIRDAVMAPGGDFVYAARLGSCDRLDCRLGSTSQLRTLRRDRESGSLALQDRYWYFSAADDMDSLSIHDDERLFVTRRASGLTAMYELAAGVLTPSGTSVSLLSVPDVSTQLARPFEFSSARPGSAAVDVFGTDVAVGFEVLQGEVDLLANGRTDRFGNRLPLFGAPNGLAASPDGRHVYVSTYQHGVVAFERVGAGVEHGDPYARLGILEVSSGTVSFAGEMDSDGCVAVDDLEHDGVAYTVRSSKWQWRPNADWPWTDVAGTAKTGEFCPHTPAEPGHYRLVVEMDVDGTTTQYASNVLVEDDHGDSIDDATAVGVPSVTGGWLDPDDEDYFRIELEVAGQLTVHSEGWIDAEGRLLDEDGDFIASDSDGAADYNFRIARDMDAGTHFVRVHEWASRAGAYTLHVDFEAHMSDLVVEAVSVSDASPDPGASFTLSATVRNDGKADSTATTLRYYRSTDGSISVDDAELGTDEVGAVMAAEKSEHSVDVTAPEEPGTYYYGACVDAVDGESDTTNNCSGAAAVSVAMALDESNGNPTGVAHANDMLFVLDDSDDKVYAYTTSGGRDADADFDLDDANGSPSGIVFANDRFLVVDSLDDKVYAYGRSGERDASSDFDLASANGAPRGIAATDDTIHVVDYWDEKVYVYRTTGERVASSDFDLAAPNSHPAGMTHADGALYVLDSIDDSAYAYATSGERDVDNEFDLKASNSSPTGMAHGNGSFFVVDSTADQLFVYSGGGATGGP